MSTGDRAWVGVRTSGELSQVMVQSIYAIGRNYAQHAAELGNPVPEAPVVFLKSTASLRRLEEAPVPGWTSLPFAHEVYHHEAEVVVLVGNPCSLGSIVTWNDVAALGLGLDVTRRGEQDRLKAKALPWTVAKSFAGAAVVTPFLPVSRFRKLDSLEFRCHINGELRQEGCTGQMLFGIPALLTFLATLAPLYPGDLLFTGTPAGVGPLRVGDRVDLTWCEHDQTYTGVV